MKTGQRAKYSFIKMKVLITDTWSKDTPYDLWVESSRLMMGKKNANGVIVWSQKCNEKAQSYYQRWLAKRIVS